MNATTNRHIRKTLGSMMTLIIMLLCGNMMLSMTQLCGSMTQSIMQLCRNMTLLSGSMKTWAQDEKEIYSTNFQNRDAADAYQDSESTKSKVPRATAFLRHRKQTEKKLHTNTCNVSDHAQRNRAWTDRA